MSIPFKMIRHICQSNCTVCLIVVVVVIMTEEQVWENRQFHFLMAGCNQPPLFIRRHFR